MISKLLKVAVIRDPSVPPGQPGPLWLNCRCGAKPVTHWEDGEIVRCVCGMVYQSDGYILEEPHA